MAHAHLALMQALAALGGSQQGRILNSPSPVDGGYNWGTRGFDHGQAPSYNMIHPDDQSADGGFGPEGVGPPGPSRPDGGYNWARRSFGGPIQQRPNAKALAQSLLSQTRNPNYSHQNAMGVRFMKNLGAK